MIQMSMLALSRLFMYLRGACPCQPFKRNKTGLRGVRVGDTFRKFSTILLLFMLDVRLVLLEEVPLKKAASGSGIQAGKGASVLSVEVGNSDGRNRQVVGDLMRFALSEPGLGWASGSGRAPNTPSSRGQRSLRRAPW